MTMGHVKFTRTFTVQTSTQPDDSGLSNYSSPSGGSLSDVRP
jgi:hypothetical protein